MFHEFIASIVDGKHLSREDASAAMRIIMAGEATPAQVGAFLTALRMKGETVDEIAGFAATMRQFATRVESHRRPLVDTCGTGGDHSGTFNISTTAGFVVAGARVAVAKHGNRSASSRCGSADVLEALGVNIGASPELVGRCIDEVGIGFLFARNLHTAMKHVAGPRTELKIRTVFNILGPLTNPAGACGQVEGVFSTSLVEPIANVLAILGIRHAFVVAGSDGLDELTLGGTSIVAETQNGKVRRYEVAPEDFHLARAPKEALVGGDAARNAELLTAVLKGAKGPHRDIVLLNAAPAIIAGEGANDWPSAIEAAAASIDSGAAWATLQELIRVSNHAG